MADLAFSWQIVPGALAGVLSVILAAAAFRRVSADPLSWPLALCNVAIGIWIFSFLADEAFETPFWRAADRASSVFVLAPGIHLVYRFVGMRNRVAIVAIYILTFGVGIFSATALDFGIWRRVPHFVLGSIALIWSLTTLFVYAKRVADVRERLKAQIILVAWIVGWALAAFELTHTIDLGTLATLVVTSSFGLLVFGDFVQTEGLSTAAIVGWTSLGGIGLLSVALGSVLLWNDFAWARAGFLVSAFIVIAAAFWGASELWFGVIKRVRGMWLVGRMSDQLAHDLQNPIAAIRGAAQYLRDDIVDPNQKEMVQLIEEQTRRLETSVSLYRRLAHGQCESLLVDATAFFAEVAKIFGIDVEDREMFLQGYLDRGLMQIALENIFSNAIRATRESGVVRAYLEFRDAMIFFVVEDSGIGMSARDVARCRDSFFTKFEGGTGLGLSLADRVATMHGGILEIESVLNRGTIVRLGCPRFDASANSE